MWIILKPEGLGNIIPRCLRSHREKNPTHSVIVWLTETTNQYGSCQILQTYCDDDRTLHFLVEVVLQMFYQAFNQSYYICPLWVCVCIYACMHASVHV